MWFIKVIGWIIISKTHTSICLYESNRLGVILMQCAKIGGTRKRLCGGRGFAKAGHYNISEYYLQLQGAFTFNLSIIKFPKGRGFARGLKTGRLR